jgi:hypothetical protein
MPDLPASPELPSHIENGRVSNNLIHNHLLQHFKAMRKGCNGLILLMRRVRGQHPEQA